VLPGIRCGARSFDDAYRELVRFDTTATDRAGAGSVCRVALTRCDSREEGICEDGCQ
jgi:hypothetical protein